MAGGRPVPAAPISRRLAGGRTTAAMGRFGHPRPVAAGSRAATGAGRCAAAAASRAGPPRVQLSGDVGRRPRLAGGARSGRASGGGAKRGGGRRRGQSIRLTSPPGWRWMRPSISRLTSSGAISAAGPREIADQLVFGQRRWGRAGRGSARAAPRSRPACGVPAGSAPGRSAVSGAGAAGAPSPVRRRRHGVQRLDHVVGARAPGWRRRGSAGCSPRRGRRTGGRAPRSTSRPWSSAVFAVISEPERVGGLDHDDGARQPRDDAVAGGEVARLRRGAHRRFREPQPRAADLFAEHGVLVGVDHVDPAGEHRDGAGLRARPGGRRCRSRGRGRTPPPDPSRPSSLREPARHAQAQRRGVAGADHGDHRTAEQRGIADRPEKRRRIGDLGQRGGVGGRAEGDDLGAGTARGAQLLLDHRRAGRSCSRRRRRHGPPRAAPRARPGRCHGLSTAGRRWRRRHGASARAGARRGHLPRCGVG